MNEAFIYKAINSAISGDADPDETSEWVASLESVALHHGVERARFLLDALDKRAMQIGIAASSHPYSLYRNTIQLDNQPPFPGDFALEERITAIIRWNALAMVVRANGAHGELGGHIASYASAAEIFETGINHFYMGDGGANCGDLVFFQPHSAPGVYARAFLEGRLDDTNLALYRQELAGNGLSSYPHPWLMPNFWQFPTGSMGLGPISVIYQARFMRYLRDRGLVDCAGRHVWGGFGDGEMDEPESLAALARRAREARQFDLHHQLQSPTSRWSRARKRADRDGAGELVQGRRLERNQGSLGLRVGRDLRARQGASSLASLRGDGRRQISDAWGEGRRVQPRQFLRR